MNRLLALILMVAGGAAFAQAQSQARATSGTGAILRGLDKVSGQTVDVELARGETAEIFGVDVALGDCRYPAENPTGDAYAFLTIWERDGREALFDGWMIASSPALSALDHARYDVWVIRCMTP